MCESEEPLEVLLTQGFSPHRVDSNSMTPLMYACIANRPKNITRPLGMYDFWAKETELSLEIKKRQRMQIEMNWNCDLWHCQGFRCFFCLFHFIIFQSFLRTSSGSLTPNQLTNGLPLCRLLAAKADPLARSRERNSFHLSVQYGSGEALKALVAHMVTLAAEMPPPVKGTLSKCLEFPHGSNPP